jgi:hypothetical protein
MFNSVRLHNSQFCDSPKSNDVSWIPQPVGRVTISGHILALLCSRIGQADCPVEESQNFILCSTRIGLIFPTR